MKSDHKTEETIVVDPGEYIGPYHVIRKIGSGGFGAVVLARAPTGASVAVKYCTRTDADLIRRFRREVRAQTKFDHPNIVRILDHDLEHNSPYFVMEVAKGTLEGEVDLLARDQLGTLRLMLHVFAGVQEIHDTGISHRDLKPVNILRLADGSVAVGDFGLAKIDPRDSTILTQTRIVMGTDGYVAPEAKVAGGFRDTGPRADIYALGATLYHILTGGDPQAIDTTGLSPSLAKIIDRATASAPSRRYQTVSEFGDAIQAYIDAQVNPDQALDDYEDALLAVEQTAKTNQYRPKEVKLLLARVRPLVTMPRVLVDQFDKIPTGILEVAARHYADELADALDAYRAAMHDVLGPPPFDYAETVADRMERVIKTATSSKLKALAWRAALVAAADLHRFNAWDSVGAMAIEFRTDEEAVALAEVICEEADRVNLVAGRIGTNRCHRFVRKALREVRATTTRTVPASDSNPF